MPFLPVVQIVVALSGAPMVVAEAPTVQRALADAVELFESFEDERAKVEFLALLGRSPPDEVAAKAHIYLGLIAFNAFQTSEAKAEFRLALEANFAEDLPQNESPKARGAFQQVRRALTAELDTPKSAQPVARRAPAAATSGEAAAVEESPQPRSHVAAYVLGSVTLLLAATAVYGGVEVVNYGSMIGSEAPGRPVYTYDQIVSARNQAGFWSVGWPVAAGLALAGAIGAGLTW